MTTKLELTLDILIRAHEEIEKFFEPVSFIFWPLFMALMLVPLLMVSIFSALFLYPTLKYKDMKAEALKHERKKRKDLYAKIGCANLSV